ncbi:HD domain-containing phosphohydrolase [Candidatus Merdisoma sp. JLR.KK011]|uniref:HD-GYP domain-containing protein n=1 Tax=Candidatus Merdisoma sp. JLR.KK011 TaxID=3114299 RepID=UPI002FEF72C2
MREAALREAAADDWTMFEDDATEELRHAICVSNLAYCVAKQYGLYEDPCHELAVAGMLHDIGKLRISGYLYGRDEDTLNIEEMKYVRMHPRLGYETLIRYDFSDNVLESILYHHENYDGSGYPENLAGTQIPVGARILRVCDTFAALTSDRPYRRAFDRQTAIELMIEEVKNFDMKVFLAFQTVIHDEELQHKWAPRSFRVGIAELE